MIKTAVVILNWNGKDFLEDFLPALIKNTPKEDTEIIIADNNSTDNSIEFLNKNHPDIRQIIFEKNYGFTGGYNKAFKQIDAKYFVLLNSDIEVSENWLSPLINLLDSDTTIAACQPKIKSFKHKNKFEYAGASGGFIDKYGYPFCRGRILDTTETDMGQYNDIHDVFWASGACMVVRADLYKRVGELDDDFFAHMEEIDLCWRLKNIGFRIVCNPASTVYHVGGGTLPNNSPFKLYLNFRNNLFLLYKNLPKGKLFAVIFSRMVLDGLSAIVFLLKGSLSSFFAIQKAHIHFYKSLGKLRKKRKLLVANEIVTNHKEIYPRSIVFDYFVQKKQTYKSLNL
ncbi:MAG: glycosyltransferase family 2 protein [Bacteroidales bacterium]|jgi:GT2 family glycosyltransferase|nr:glycosyltransferase family 2 protein [Bacteroidales bacterium]